MLRARDILRRLRTLSPPGPAGPQARAGVPGDLLAELSSELAPIFAALAGTETEAAAMRSRAAQEASRRREQAAAGADQILAEADSQLAEERLVALEQAKQASSQEISRLLAQAEQEADRQREFAARQIPPIVALVVADVRRRAGSDLGDTELADSEPSDDTATRIVGRSR
jgi:cell division septum initiation protein DivIVA